MELIIGMAVAAVCLSFVAGCIADWSDARDESRMEARIRAIEIKLGPGGWLDRPARTAELGGDEVRS